MRKVIKDISEDVDPVDPVQEAIADAKKISRPEPVVEKVEPKKIDPDDSRAYTVLYANPQSDDLSGVTIMLDVTTSQKRSPSLGHASIDLNGASFPCFVSQVVPLNMDGTHLPDGTKESDRFQIKVSIPDTLIQRVAPFCKDLKTLRIY
jgi:hypothetical protein